MWHVIWSTIISESKSQYILETSSQAAYNKIYTIDFFYTNIDYSEITGCNNF